MFGRAIWDKLPECTFENFEIASVKRGQFQYFQKSRGWFIPHNCPYQTCDYWLSDQTNENFLLKLTYFNRGQLQISERAIIK